MRGKQIVISGGQGIGLAVAAAASFAETTRQVDLREEAVRDKGPTGRNGVIRCRECLKTSPLRRVQHFYLCEKHYKVWKKPCD